MEDLDSSLADVRDALLSADPTGERMGQVFRDAFDYLYDGQRTGRYHPDQLSKTEKTHCGSIVEIYLRRELASVIHDGESLDYKIAGHDVDCKFSFRRGGWMLPPESFDQILIVATADDVRGTWSLGIIRAVADVRRSSSNRDRKTSLNAHGVQSVDWLFDDTELPPNALLVLPSADVAEIFNWTSGQKRVNELFRRAELIPINRNVIATVAQQRDYMKRVRAAGGARTHLRDEGYLIPGGDYVAHQQIALDLGAPDLAPGEFVSIRVVPAVAGDTQTVALGGDSWRVALPDETVSVRAPELPTTRRAEP